MNESAATAFAPAPATCSTCQNSLRRGVSCEHFGRDYNPFFAQLTTNLRTIFFRKEIAIMASSNPFGAEGTLKTKSGDWKIFRLRKLADDKVGHIDTLQFSIRVLLEACLRNVDGFVVNESDVTELANWNAAKPKERFFRLGKSKAEQAGA